MKWLVKEFNLDTQPGKKTPIYIKDISPFNKTILSKQEKKFHLGFQRIQVCLFNSLGIFTVHRKSAMLNISSKGSSWGPTRAMIELTPLRKLFISKGYEQLLVPLDPEKSDWYIFCKTELVKGVLTIQRTTQISRSAISTLLVTFGEIYRWKGAFHAHQFRYGSGNVLNENVWWLIASAGWVSKEQHQLVDHEAYQPPHLS
ncbi:hypothetical protein N7488_003888 [Penicillium malachiteum]|nr:hypothetical protein N7488_003888 [Penicillium malachiteum]